ncbi:hypothetical protein CC86DRAFT_407040 [Ophiobolus disseminans]|uniref:Uncharacterized protein n=1 Tax=Ophiobolus disseminans TaxID=1469910 RepID=A0A6A6ZZ22_9PLEO|nr:hypothetical protein CC86DRAFT_407040 [Ophiobolus disseminans]
MPSTTESLSGLTLQLSLVKHWSAPKTNANAKRDQEMLRAYFPSLLHVTGRHLLHASSDEIGRFFGAVYNATVALAAYLLQNPPDNRDSSYCHNLRLHISERSDGIATHQLNLKQLAKMIRSMINHTGTTDSAYAARRAALLPMDLKDQESKVASLAKHLANNVLYAMVDINEHHASFRDLWTFHEYVDFTRAFANEMRRGPEADPDVLGLRRVKEPILAQFEVDETVTEHRDFGDAIPTSEFCELVGKGGVPQGTKCIVCMGKIQSNGAKTTPVVTKLRKFEV